MGSSRFKRRTFLLASAAAGAAAGFGIPAHASTNGQTVAVLGGGIAGLTAAHELAERGFAVTVYERKALGGKARSVGIPGTGADGRLDLPSEHGFRFFPGFYRNVFETMAGIPAATGSGSVADRLVTAQELTLWYGMTADGKHKRSITWANLASTTIGRLHSVVDALLNGDTPTSGPKPFGALDVAYLAHLLGVVAFADRHKLLELEGYSFADYTCTVFAERSVLKPSAKLVDFLQRTGTRLLVAAQPDQMSARTGLVTLLRLLNPLELYTERGDRLLRGPTNREWIDPWVDDLGHVSARRPSAVHFHRGRRVVDLDLQGSRAVSFRLDSGAIVTSFDHVVCALPHGALRAIVGSPLPAPLAGLSQLRDGWMVGVQYFLRTRAALCKGHSVHVDSEWSLTSVHSGQFWPGYPWPAPTRDVLSVCVSDWDTPAPSPLGKRARDCTSAEVLAEVWRQLCVGVNSGPGPDLLPWDRTLVVEDECVDEAVAFSGAAATNRTPLFVNTVGSWQHRPPADVGFDNLYLAGDYVRTNADLATMESANESARRAVQALLDADGFTGAAVKINDIDHLGLLED